MKLKPQTPMDVLDRIRETQVWKSVSRPGLVLFGLTLLAIPLAR